MAKSDLFETAKGMFLKCPSVATASAYLSTALVSENDEIISETEFRGAVSEVATFLSEMAMRELLQSYGNLHDRLSEMIENGRLTKSDFPDDYDWLVEMLVSLVGPMHVVLGPPNSAAK